MKQSVSSIPYILVLPLFTGLSIYSTYVISDGISTSNILSPVAMQAPQNSTPPTEISQTKQPPTSIYIPRINKRLSIQAAIVQDNNWQLFDSSVAWLSTSAVPMEGNVILYAHNWKSLWADLYKVKEGDKIEVEQNGKVTVYAVTQSRSVSKTDVDVVLSDENRLTMYTCEGSFDQKRRVVYAVPI